MLVLLLGTVPMHFGFLVNLNLYSPRPGEIWPITESSEETCHNPCGI